MNKGGFVFLYRSIIEWEWYPDLPTSRLFIHLILTSEWKTIKYLGLTVEAGMRRTTQEELMKETNLTRQQIRRAIKNLEKSNSITCKSTNKYTLITITNWDKYQNTVVSENQRTTNEHPSNNQLEANEQPTSNQCYIKEIININNNKNKKENNRIDAQDENDCSAIIEYLNRKAGKKYKTIERYRVCIIERINEGYSFEDFITVIDKQVPKWLGTPMEDNLRPDVLFSNKMDAYLNGSDPTSSIFVRNTLPSYIIQQMNGTLPEETKASKEEIEKIHELQAKMKY